MDALMISIQPFFVWLLQATLSASVVIFLILVAQKVLGSKFGPRWCHALWLVLLLRLVLPGTFPHQVNLLSLGPSVDQQAFQQQPSDVTQGQESLQAAQAAGAESMSKHRAEADLGIQGQTTPKTGMFANLQIKSKSWMVSLQRVLPFVWLVGAVVIGLYLLLSNFYLWRVVKRERPLLDQETLELFEECKERMGIHTIVGLIPSSRIKTPALFGFIRPRLLLPTELLEKTSQEELRYIFLHELAHLKRLDIYLGWLTSLLLILHWFNPLVWFAFFRMRADRELSCDALVLSRTGTDESKEYGQAIVGLVRRFSRSQPLPAMAGILENKSQLKRRITMISQFKKGSYQWSPLAVILILALSLVSFSFAVGSWGQNTFLPKSEPSISLRRVVTGPISDFSGPPSLDGRYLCDIRPTSELTIAELVIRDLATDEIQPLTKVSRNGMWHPTISPENTRIAFMNQFYPAPETELQMINMDGTGHRTLQRFEGGENFVIRSWTPDGIKIIGDLRKSGEDRKLISFSSEDGSMQVLHTFDTDKPSSGRLVISPDGRYVAYERSQGSDSQDKDIYILDIEINQTKPLVQHAADDRLLGWTPDNRYIFFASNRKRGYPGAFSISDTWDAYLLPVVEGVSQGAPELVKRDIPAKIRPKGFTRDGSFYYAVEFSTMEAVVAEVDVQTGKLLSKPQTIGQSGTDVTPAWSPDGRYLAYSIQNPDESQTIRIRNMKSGQERVLEPDLPQFFSLRWSPDGKFILVSTFKPKEPQAVYRINASTDEREMLVKSESAMLGAAQMSRDGKTLFYVAFQPNSRKASLLSKDMDTNQEQDLYSMENSMGAQGLNFALSPDGKQLALATFERQLSPMKLFHHIFIIPVQGGEPKELFRNQELKQYPLIDWTPDGQFLLFSNSHFRGRPSAVWRIPAKGGQAKELCRPQTMMYGVLWSSLDVHPDGKHIAFDCFEYRHEVWVMENFLPKTSASPDSNL